MELGTKRIERGISPFGKAFRAARASQVAKGLDPEAGEFLFDRNDDGTLTPFHTRMAVPTNEVDPGNEPGAYIKTLVDVPIQQETGPYKGAFIRRNPKTEGPVSTNPLVTNQAAHDEAQARIAEWNNPLNEEVFPRPTRKPVPPVPPGQSKDKSEYKGSFFPEINPVSSLVSSGSDISGTGLLAQLINTILSDKGATRTRKGAELIDQLVKRYRSLTRDERSSFTESSK